MSHCSNIKGFPHPNKGTIFATAVMIPLIDCSPIAKGSFEDVPFEDYKKVAEDIGAAMTGIGMCNLINHGVSQAKIEKVHEVTKTFFELPRDIKLKYRKVNPKRSFSGYSGSGDELLAKGKNSIELRDVWDTSAADGFDDVLYPNEEVPDFKSAFDEARIDLANAAKKIIRCIEIYLNLENGALISKHKNLWDDSIKTKTQLRSLYYYVLNRNDNFPPNAIRLGEHSDYGTLTFLFQDMIGGLEVKTSEDEWIEATPVKNAILLNGGQLLEYWTGGRFHAALHRVRIRTEGRLTEDVRRSFAYLINPDGDTNVHPLLPVLSRKKNLFENLNDKPVNAFDYYQRLIEEISTH